MKDSLKHEINWRIQFVVNDCTTFIRVRGELRDWYNHAGVGGGNFMMAQSLFSALNFLAKVHARLQYREKYFYSNEHKDAVKRAVQLLKDEAIQPKLEDLLSGLRLRAMLRDDSLTQWKPPRPGDCADETRVFKLLVEAMSGSLNLGVSSQESGQVWRQFRNALAHMAAPQSMVECEGPTRELPSFRKSATGTWICNVDRLTEDVQAVASWVCDVVEHQNDQSRIIDTLNWIVDAPGTNEAGFTTTTTSTSTVTESRFQGYTGPYSYTHIPPPFDPEKVGTPDESTPDNTDPKR